MAEVRLHVCQEQLQSSPPVLKSVSEVVISVVFSFLKTTLLTEATQQGKSCSFCIQRGAVTFIQLVVQWRINYFWEMGPKGHES